MARLRWADRSPVGECVYRGREQACTTVIGVIADARRFNIVDEQPHPYAIVVGLAMAAIGSRFIAHLLFGVSPHDPIVFGIIAGAVLAVAAAATLLPAWRASSVDPGEALRAE